MKPSIDITNVLLVARREIHQILKMKSFWLTLLILPVAFALGPIFADTLEDNEPTRVTVVDRSGGDAEQALEALFAAEEAQGLLRELSRYVRRYDLQHADPQAPWAKHDRWYTAADIIAFERAGGIEAALEKIDAVRPEGVPAFEPEETQYIFSPIPEALIAAEGEAFGTQARALFDADDDTAPEIVVLIGENYPANPRIQLFSANPPQGSFVTTIQEALTADLRARLLAAQGIPPANAAAVQSAAPIVAVDTPPPGGGAREALLVRSIVPLALAYILVMSLILSGSWMLQGSVEERSKKLLESLLACIRPEDLMYGKLLGSLSVGLLMILVWGACAGVAAYATHGVIADMIRPALDPVSSPGIIAAILFFFIAGYIAISALFVAIGAMVDSMSEAQGYLMPVMLLILLPVTFLIQTILAGNSGWIVQVLTWVPLWTPFTVLARLGMGIEWWEMVGSGALLATAIALELVLIGRLFRASLLASGQKPSFKRMIERLRGTPG
ncbi:ABC transporter permease [Qipengyuania qiaonensis]|uniref:ABC transporter permease n=1 Tax=Qipengyuania qiaonensis TaxID=2867240 RepID=A0ABS7JB81_9SPHN|nr:ABC transporter permease [Qipengyuania qiaonensis]MBX7482277.1 ABC transporter permease [Qipengyuania qiaonensis]